MTCHLAMGALWLVMSAGSFWRIGPVHGFGCLIIAHIYFVQ